MKEVKIKNRELTKDDIRKIWADLIEQDKEMILKQQKEIRNEK